MSSVSLTYRGRLIKAHPVLFRFFYYHWFKKTVRALVSFVCFIVFLTARFSYRQDWRIILKFYTDVPRSITLRLHPLLWDISAKQDKHRVPQPRFSWLKPELIYRDIEYCFVYCLTHQMKVKLISLSMVSESKVCADRGKLQAKGKLGHFFNFSKKGHVIYQMKAEALLFHFVTPKLYDGCGMV